MRRKRGKMRKILLTILIVFILTGCKSNISKYISNSPYKVETPLTLYEGYSITSEKHADIKVDDEITVLFTGLNFNEQHDVYCIKLNGSINTWDGFILMKDHYLSIKNGSKIPNYNWEVALNSTNEIMAINVNNKKIIILNKNSDVISEISRKKLIRNLPDIYPEYYTFIIDDRIAGFINDELYIKVGIEDMSTLKGYLVYNYLTKSLRYIAINVRASDLQINKNIYKLLYSDLPEYHELDRLNDYVRKNNEIVYTFDLRTLEQIPVANFNKYTEYSWKNNEVNFKP